MARPGMIPQQEWQDTEVGKVSTYACGKCGEVLSSPQAYYDHVDEMHDGTFSISKTQRDENEVQEIQEDAAIQETRNRPRTLAGYLRHLEQFGSEGLLDSASKLDAADFAVLANAVKDANRR